MWNAIPLQGTPRFLVLQSPVQDGEPYDPDSVSPAEVKPNCPGWRYNTG